jgi:hypothetical protein
MESESSLPSSEKPTIGSSPKSHELSLYPSILYI